MDIHNINTIARYEVKLLKRSWLFRIFATLALLGVSFTIVVYQTKIFNPYDTIWSRVAVSSLMPFVCIYLYNVAQSIIVIFLAGSFLKRDKKLDTAEVIYVRPMSNADYIIGKTWGIVQVFLSLNVIILLITAFLNILIAQSPFSFFPYIFYLLTISIPSLFFILGLSFTAMCLLKNQAVTFMVMLGVVGMVFFYLTESLFGVFDFFGVHLPAIFSDVTGHADIYPFLLQRMIYLLAGIGLLCFTIGLVKRLPHKPWKIVIVNTLGGIFLLTACGTGWIYVSHYQKLLANRNEYTTSFNKYAGEKNAQIVTHQLTVKPEGKHLEGKSVVKLKNSFPTPLGQLIFYLNPSLAISSIEANGESLPFTRDHQVVIVNKALNSGEELTLTMTYQGGITETICYADVPKEEYLNIEIPGSLFRYGKRYAWLEDQFTLLTPECLWYPVTVSPVYPAAPYNIRKNFTDFTLIVDYAGNQTLLSQGKCQKEGNKTVFTNRFPLPGISLTIADYEKKTLQVDSVCYGIYYFKGHDYFSKHFTKLNDTLPAIIRNIKNDLEIGKGRNYPFDKFILAEAPVQLASYLRNWKGTTEFVMPEIVFVPERGVTLESDFQAERKRMLEWRRGDEGTLDETQIEIEILNNFISSNFTQSTIMSWNMGLESTLVNPYKILPMLFEYTGFIQSNEYPVIDIVLNTMQNTFLENGLSPWSSVINDKQRANLYLESHNFETALKDEKIKPAVFYELLKLKSTALKNYVIAQVPSKDFSDFLEDFFNRYRFRDIPLKVFTDEIQQRFGLDVTNFIHTWYTEDHSPTLFIKEADANQIIMDEITRYQVKFKIYNPSDVDAIITALTIQGGGRGWGRHGDRRRGEMSQNYLIPAHTAWEIKIINDERPANLTVNTNISHNLPTTHNFNFSKVDKETSDTLSGIFAIDPMIFQANPNEIIIDNESSGFKTFSSNSRHKLKDFFKKEEEEKYKNFKPWRMPSQWTLTAADYCYGETTHSAVYKNKGSGANSVEWKAEIPKDGYYEVSIWNPTQAFGRMMGMGMGMRRRGEQSDRKQTYTILYGQQKETVTLDLEEENNGWVSIGNFYLSQGEVSIQLTDKVSGYYVIADAVKFTIVNE